MFGLLFSTLWLLVTRFLRSCGIRLNHVYEALGLSLRWHLNPAAVAAQTNTMPDFVLKDDFTDEALSVGEGKVGYSEQLSRRVNSRCLLYLFILVL